MKNKRIINENATPRDRISREMFRNEYGKAPQGSDVWNGMTDPVQNGDAENTHCAKDDIFSGVYPIAMSYTPVEEWGNLFTVEEGFSKGTVFSELYFPFYGDIMKGECMR